MKIKLLYILCLIIYSCGLIEYHPYDGELNAPLDINHTNIERIIQEFEGKETLRFIMTGDSQRWYDETEDFVKHVNSHKNVDFVIHGGDITDFGMAKEFEWIHEIMSKLKAPYLAIIGNHDIIGGGSKVYRKMYGDDNFSFIIMGIKFVFLNTNSLEYKIPYPVPNLHFIKDELDDSEEHTRTIVAMHAPPKSEQMSLDVALAMHQEIKKFKGLMFCVNAHDHNTKIRDIYDDGVLYYGCAAMKKRSYLLFEVTLEGYRYEEIFY